MPRKSTPPRAQPALSSEKAIPILEQLIAESSDLYTQGENSANMTEWMQTAENALIGAFGDPSSNLQSFGRAQTGSYSPYDTEEYRKEQFEDQLNGMVAVLKSSVKQLRWTLPDPTQVFLPAGSQHDAFVEIRSIIKTATIEITIVDPYVDETLWPLLKNLPASVRIRILTNHLKGDFSLEAKKFIAQHTNPVEVRQTSNYHDRFLIVDGQKCWHLGASIKDAGSKAFLISQVQSPNVVNAVKSDINSEWAGASITPI